MADLPFNMTGEIQSQGVHSPKNIRKTSNSKMLKKILHKLSHYII